jgi:DNA-binding LytR/AlgR family response regulator
MDIIIQDPQPGEGDSVVIRVKHITESVVQAISILKSPGSLTVYDGDQAIMLAPKDIYYIESVDLKTFIYAEKSVYRSRLKLYEIGEALVDCDFLRVSKQTIVNVKRIRSVAPAGEGRFYATLANSEKIIISRQYVPSLKERFGI